jgi:outer membrane protein assembly factor BamB
MRGPITRVVCGAIVAVASIALLQGQGRGGGEWTTSGFDAQRTAWLRADARLTRDAVQKGEFQFLWKAKFENEPRQLNSLTTPILLDLLIGYRGFKALAFIGGSEDRVYAIDTDLARPYWMTVLNYSAATGGRPPSSWECPGGLIATPSRRTVLAPSAFGAGSGGERGGARTGSAVGQPGKGAAVLSQQQQQRGAGRGRGAAPAGPPQQARGRGRGPAPIGFGGVDPVYVMGSDGYLHTLRSSNGSDAEPSVPFLPPNTRPSALLWVDGVVYTATSNGCGAAPNAVWAIDLTAPERERRPLSWATGGPAIAGTNGLALGRDGTVYVAVATASAQPKRTPAATDGQGTEETYADSVVALDPVSLKPKDWFSAPGADFNVSPTVIRHKDKDLVAVTGNDGRLYLLDGVALGGADHKTPLHVSAKYTSSGAGAALATWEDQGTRWILAPAVGAEPVGVKFTQNGLAPNGRVVAFKLVDRDETLSLEPAWASRDLISPLGPIVVNGMVFAVSSGEYRPAANTTMSAAQRAQRSVPAVLYVLDGATGKTLWSSGTKITSFARAGMSAGGGQVYLVTYDNHLYAFGIPMEH